ncbi:MAG: AI-2E family transporter [Nanoarchaeota archaeon]|nr:AI-2E family transporter [Nanoarchaeota archaeon]
MKHKHSKYFFIGLFLIILLLAFFVVKGLIISVLASIVLSYFFYPVYRFLLKYIKNKSLCSFLMILILIFIITLPSIFIVQSLVGESIGIYNYFTNLNLSLDPIILNALDKAGLFFITSVSGFLLKIPNMLINIFVTLFVLFYLFKDGEMILKKIKDMLPLDDKHKNSILNEFKQVTNAVAYGLILVGFIEWILASIGFYLFGVSNPIFWGLIIFILVILPAVGSSLVWLPLGIIKLVNGEMFSGVGILIYGVIVLAGVEMFLKPKLIGDKAKMHPIIIILGVVGGLKFFGFIGLIFGPLILVILITMFKFLVVKK